MPSLKTILLFYAPPPTLGGLVFCGQCGAPLAPAVNGGKTTKRAYYRCTRHNIYGNGVCANSRNFPEKLLNEVVLNDLRLLAEKASKNKQELVDEVIAMNRSRSRDEVSSAAERAKALQAEHDKANTRIKKLFAQYDEGLISSETYAMLVGECEEKKAACNVELSNLKAIANEEVIERSVAEQWADEVERFLKLETLTRETAVALIDSITALSTRDEQDNEHIALKIKYRAVGCLEAA